MRIVMAVAVVVAVVACGESKGKLPKDKCDRLAACGIDKSCGGSLLGEKAHAECGKQPSCDKIRACVARSFNDGLAKAKTVGDLNFPVQLCARLPRFKRTILAEPGVKDACMAAFGRLEALAGKAAANSSDSALACAALEKGAALAPELKDRAKRACPTP